MRLLVSLAMAGGVGVLTVAAALADREPVPWWSVLAGLVLVGFGSCAVIQAPSWRRLLVGLATGTGVCAVVGVEHGYGPGHGKAIVATARKLALLFWCTLTRGEDYADHQPFTDQEEAPTTGDHAGAPKYANTDRGI